MAKTHGLTGTRIYAEWKSMKARCFTTTSKAYIRYGGRGITVCDEWLDNFQSFYDWAMSNGYSNILTLDRINNDGNYEPSNCRWVSRTIQMNNTSRNVFVTLNGETKTFHDWIRELNLTKQAIIDRVYKCGWSMEEALTRPIRRRRRPNGSYHEVSNG